MNHDPSTRSRPRRVLVANGTYESAYGIVRSLVESGAQVHVAHSERAQDVAVSRLIAGAHPVPPPRRAYDHLTAEGSAVLPDPFATAVLGLARRIGADVVIPTDDDEVVALASHREEFTDAGVLCTVPAMATARTMMDKYLAVTAAAGAGIPTPRTERIDDLAALRTFAADQGYPFVFKKRVSSGSKGVRVIRSAAQLDRAYADFAGSPAMAQEYVPGEREPSINAIRDAGGGFRLVLSLRKQRYLNTSVSTCIRIVPELPETAAALRFLDAVGAVGFAAIQVRENPLTGEHLFIESNTRWGANSRMLLPLLRRQGYRAIEHFVAAWEGEGRYEGPAHRPESGAAVSPVEDLLAVESFARHRRTVGLRGGRTIGWGTLARAYWESYGRAKPLVTDYLFASALTDPRAAASTLRRAFRERRREDLSFLPLGELTARP
ncbi:ATP-grasp domain-containing protein [Kitasatospora sp. NPDC047058]|uniref:ATP-grasp domain-containing protein n=1 Tax=Kitasatospora sp. NPDC047058 TaxID=3155620 RepID=UPI0033D6A06B